MLFSGCVMGTVKTWKLGNLEALTYSAKIRQRANVLHDAFQVICGAEQAQNGDENDSMSRDEDDVGGAYGSSKARAHAAPTGKLCSGQRSWRAHLAAVVSIEWVDYAEHQLLITSGSDCNVNLWTIDGMHIGTFGQAHPWNIARSTTWLCTAAASPIDGGNMGTAAPNGTERNEHQGDSESECSSGEDDSAVFRSCQSLDRLEREQVGNNGHANSQQKKIPLTDLFPGARAPTF
jgi:WD40 repeat protein